MVCLQIVDLGSRLAANLQQVLETRGGDERDLTAAPLDERVGCYRSAVGEKGEVASGISARSPCRMAREGSSGVEATL